MKTIQDFFEEMKPPCYWHDDVICVHKRHCHSCEHQPDDNKKINGTNDPIPIGWKADSVGIMPVCPACGEIPYSFDRCIFCGQRFIKDERMKVWTQLKKVERMDCPVCGGKDTLEFTRSRYNGHKHGHCTACGVKIME